MRPDKASFCVCVSVLQAGDISSATWRCTRDCFGLIAQATIIFRMQRNELHPRLTTEECSQGLQRACLALAEGHAADDFPWLLTKLATLETVNVYLYILSSLLLTAHPVCPTELGNECPVPFPASVEHDHRCTGRRCCRCTILLPPCRSDRGQPHANHTNHMITFPSLYTLWSLKLLCVGGCAFVFAGFLSRKCPPWSFMPRSWLLSCRLLYIS